MPARKSPPNPPDKLTSEVTPQEIQESAVQENSEPDSVTSSPESETSNTDETADNATDDIADNIASESTERNNAGGIEITELDFEEESSLNYFNEDELVITDEDEIVEEPEVQEELANEQTDDFIESDDDEDTEDTDEEYYTTKPEKTTSTFNEPAQSSRERFAESIHRNKRKIKTAINTGRADFSISQYQKINELRRHRKSKRVLEGIVSKVITLRSNNQETVCVGLYVRGYEEFKFIIPFDRFDTYIKSGQQAKTMPERIGVLRRIVGAKVHFIITKILPDMNTCIADRETANRILRGLYFYKGFRLRGDFPNSPKRYIYTGTITAANIIQVASTSMIVETFGVQYVLPIGEVSYSILSTLYGKYHSGETINVRLTSVELANDGINYGVFLSASHKATLNDIPREELKRASIGDVILANVTYIDGLTREPRGITFDGYNFSAKFIRHNLKLRVGSVVSVKVVKKVFDKKNSYAEVDLIDVKKF